MPGTVLIVDDCETTATPLEIALTAMADVRVLILSNAFDALKILADPHCNVTALVTDLHLPLMDGFDLIEKIRRDLRYGKLPIVVVTGDTNPVTRVNAFLKGANAYFPKPYSPADLRHELERLLHAG